jgi:DNA-binding NarL/FixJ family response regulator
MPQLWDFPGGTPSRAYGRERAAPAHGPRKLVLCLLPRSSRINPLAGLLKAYELCVGDSLGQLLKLSRERTFDLYVMESPLGWIGAAELCRRIRRFDPHTPVICYAMHAGTQERREVLAAGAQAYVPRAEGSHILSGTAAQLVMLTELRSDEALSAGGRTIREELAKRLARSRALRNPAGAMLRPHSQAKLKAEARRLFASAGGSRANFERAWPGLYRELLDEIAASSGGSSQSQK